MLSLCAAMNVLLLELCCLRLGVLPFWVIRSALCDSITPHSDDAEDLSPTCLCAIPFC